MANKRRGVLEDHKRVGRRLKSPWLTEFNFQFVSHVDEVLPEILLLGLLNDAHGYARGAELSLTLSKALIAVGESPDPLLSVFGGLSKARIKKIAAHLGKDLSDVQIAVMPLLMVLDEHPLGALGKPSIDETGCLQQLRNCVDRLYDRDSMPACAAMASLYYARACNGKLFISRSVRVPNLEAIISDPESDDAEHARSAVRMHGQMFVGDSREERRIDWPSLFWHRCYLASDCDVEQ